MAGRKVTDEELDAIEAEATRRAVSDEELDALEREIAPEGAELGDEDLPVRGLPFAGAAAGAAAEMTRGTGPTPMPLTGRNISSAMLSALSGGAFPAPAGMAPRPPPDDIGASATTAQGVLRNWGDEMAGAMAQTNADMRHLLGEGPADPAQITYNNERDLFRRYVDTYRNENPNAAFGLSVLGGAATAPFTGTAGVVADGAIAGMGSSQNMDADMLYRGALGGTLAYAGKQAGDILGMFGGAALGNLSQRAGNRVSAAETKAQELAAEKVAAEIASAKGKLGATTQEANRAVENLLRLESTGALTGAQQALLANLRQNGTLPALEQKLADSMLEQVPGAAGRVDIARAAMDGLVDRQSQAIAEGAETVLSGTEAKRQIGERVRRYLPTIAGSMMGAGAGAGTGLALGGSPSEAIIGALAGAGIRPALRAGQRMVAHPAVQRGMYAPLQGAAAAGAEAVSSVAPRAGMAVGEQSSVSQWLEQSLVDRPESLGPYAAQLQQAAANGNLALAHWGLQQRDPNYRATIEAARKEQQ